MIFVFKIHYRYAFYLFIKIKTYLLIRKDILIIIILIFFIIFKLAKPLITNRIQKFLSETLK